jgi:long-chain acyl-CoA synthetase
MTAALYFGDLVRTGGEVAARGAKLAGGLMRIGMKEGDVVALLTRNDPVYADAVPACRTGGFYYCPVNWHFTRDEAAFLVIDSGSKALIVAADLYPAVKDAIPAGVKVLVSGAPAGQLPAGTLDYESWLLEQSPYDGPVVSPRGHLAYSSGTTGRPKGVLRKPWPVAQVADAQKRADKLTAECFGVVPGCRTLMPAPLYHSAPSAITQATLRIGERLVIMPRFDPEETLRLVEAHRIDLVYMVPTMYIRLLKLPEATRRRYDLSTLRFIASTGSPCPPEVKRAMIDWLGPKIYETYAASETGLITIMSSVEALARPGSAGRPAGEAIIRIAGEDGRPCPTGGIGQIYMKQPAYADFTYVGNDQARRVIEKDGLVTLGDMGYLDPEGYLYICDRSADMVISGGVNIYPAEIEHALVGCPGVLDCAVFGVPDEEMGERLMAAILPEHGAHVDAAAVEQWLRPRIAGYKIPRDVTTISEFPRDDNGKVAKRKLRAKYWEGRERRV